MVTEEIFTLTKHANFSAKYIENIPVWKRRFYLYLLNKEVEEQEKELEKIKNSSR